MGGELLSSSANYNNLDKELKLLRSLCFEVSKKES